jgi:hypothetical protein
MASVEIGIEARIARLESDVGHMGVDIADIKTEIAARRLGAKTARVEPRPTSSTDELQRSLRSAIRWALWLYIVFAVGVYTLLARTFGWI